MNLEGIVAVSVLLLVLKVHELDQLSLVRCEPSPMLSAQRLGLLGELVV